MSDSTAQRPSPELMARLREGKRQLHASQRTLSPEEKVRMVIELQRFTLPILARRRPLGEIERPWPLDE